MPSFGKILGVVSEINCVTNGLTDKGDIIEPVASLVQQVLRMNIEPAPFYCSGFPIGILEKTTKEWYISTKFSKFSNIDIFHRDAIHFNPYQMTMGTFVFYWLISSHFLNRLEKSDFLRQNDLSEWVSESYKTKFGPTCVILENLVKQFFRKFPKTDFGRIWQIWAEWEFFSKNQAMLSFNHYCSPTSCQVWGKSLKRFPRSICLIQA